jgi:hypothetical protein
LKRSVRADEITEQLDLSKARRIGEMSGLDLLIGFYPVNPE